MLKYIMELNEIHKPILLCTIQDIIYANQYNSKNCQHFCQYS